MEKNSSASLDESFLSLLEEAGLPESASLGDLVSYHRSRGAYLKMSEMVSLLAKKEAIVNEAWNMLFTSRQSAVTSYGPELVASLVQEAANILRGSPEQILQVMLRRAGESAWYEGWRAKEQALAVEDDSEPDNPYKGFGVLNVSGPLAQVLALLAGDPGWAEVTNFVSAS